jgi:ATP-dependent DNA ligase
MAKELKFPLWPPYPPMEALSVGEIPQGNLWQYEPKWDGFRVIAFRNKQRVELQSKSCKALARYFPELVEVLLALSARQFVLDGEIVIPIKKQLSFDALLQRIHPARSRTESLARETPSKLIIFDLLVDERGRLLTQMPLTERRDRLEAFAKKYLSRNPSIKLSPATKSQRTIAKWVKGAGNSLDGIIAKRTDLEYRTGERDGMQKIKLAKTADCVVGGFRYASSGKRIGSLLLGLYNGDGKLDHVGFIATAKSFATSDLQHKLEALVGPPGFSGKAPGCPSRWSTKRSTEWQPLKPKLAVEVQYDHFTGGRFRHGTKFLRWRPDKAPKSCSIRQVQQESGVPLLAL